MQAMPQPCGRRCKQCVNTAGNAMHGGDATSCVSATNGDALHHRLPLRHRCEQCLNHRCIGVVQALRQCRRIALAAPDRLHRR